MPPDELPVTWVLSRLKRCDPLLSLTTKPHCPPLSLRFSTVTSVAPASTMACWLPLVLPRNSSLSPLIEPTMRTPESPAPRVKLVIRL